jgi:hypothetical protein
VSFLSALKNTSIGTLAPVAFYAGVGILFLALLPLANFPPHIGLTGVMSIIAAYGLFKKRVWAPWVVVALFLIALTITGFTIYFILFSNWLVSLGLIVYLILNFYFMYYTLSRGTP